MTGGARQSSEVGQAKVEFQIWRLRTTALHKRPRRMICVETALRFDFFLLTIELFFLH
jgi:hypothetical protein